MACSSPNRLRGLLLAGRRKFLAEACVWTTANHVPAEYVLTGEAEIRGINCHIRLARFKIYRSNKTLLCSRVWDLRLVLSPGERPCDPPPHSIRTAHLTHPFKALPHLHTHHRLDVLVITKSNLRPEESSVLSLFGHRQWGFKDASNLQAHGLTSLRISLIERFFITSRPMFPLLVVQLLSLGHPYPTFCCCPRWKRNPKATFVNVHSI